MTNGLEIAAMNAYNNFSNWDKAAAPAIMEANNEEELTAASEQAGIFDFQQGKSYYAGLSNLANGEVLASDKNKDGATSYEEYVEQGLKEYKGIIDEEVLNNAVENQSVLLDFWSKDIDIDDFISPEDLELFYSIADESLPSEENQRVKDGKFTQEDLAQAKETLLNSLQEENPEIEEQIMQRRDYLDLLSLDFDEDGLVQKEEYMVAQEIMQDKGNTPEAKAGAYCVFDAIDGAMGNGDGVLDEQELASYVQHQYEGGYGAEEYYNHLLEINFVDEDASNHGYYAEVLAAYQNLAKN